MKWPTMPPSKGQSPVLFEDGYAEGWAKCIAMCQEAYVDRCDYERGFERAALPEQEAPTYPWPFPTNVGRSWSGFNVCGDQASIDEVSRLAHCEARMQAFQAEVLELRAALASPPVREQRVLTDEQIAEIQDALPKVGESEEVWTYVRGSTLRTLVALSPLGRHPISHSSTEYDLFEDILVKVKFETLSRSEEHDQLRRVYTLFQVSPKQGE